MSAKRSFSDKVNLSAAKTQEAGERTVKHTFRSPAANDLVQLNARVSPELKERARIYCAVSNTSYQDLMHNALTQYLDNHE